MKLITAHLSDRMLSLQNPLRGLNMGKVIRELEEGQRGNYSDLQWLFHFIEKRDATLRGAKRRILAALLKLDWDIKVRDGLDAGQEKRAEEQQAYLTGEYRNVKGLRAALKHFALAEFRGFAHVEKHLGAGGRVVGLEPVPQWHWCRDGLYGDWEFQADALSGGTRGVPVDAARFIIREIEDPINEIALVAFCRKGLSSKDFDAYIARYGIPFVFWVLNDAMAAALASEPAKMREWMAVMRGIGSDGEGIIPGGDLKMLDTSGGGKDNNAFLQHLSYQDEQIVMAATSGKLTMLNDPSGIGGGNADVHADTFDEIALALAMEISEMMHEQFDLPVLAREFPGQEPLVYFELAAKDAEDVGKLVSNAKTLHDAGYEMDTQELSEKTGYTLTRKHTPNEDEEDAPAGEDPAGAEVDGTDEEEDGTDEEEDDEDEEEGEGEGDDEDEDEEEGGARSQNREDGMDSPRAKVAAGLLAGFDTIAAALLADSNDELTAVLADALADEPTDISEDE